MATNPWDAPSPWDIPYNESGYPFAGPEQGGTQNPFNGGNPFTTSQYQPGAGGYGGGIYGYQSSGANNMSFDPSLFNANPVPGGWGNPMNWPFNISGGAMGNAGQNIGNAMSGFGTGLQNALTGPGSPGAAMSNLGSQVQQHTPGYQAPPPSISQNAQGGGAPQVNPNTGERVNQRNQVVGGGGKAGVGMLLREQGINPSMNTPLVQMMMNDAPALTQQAKILQIMNPGMSAQDAMAEVVRRGRSNEGVFFDSNQGQDVYNKLQQLVEGQSANGGTLSGPGRLAFDTFFGADSQSPENVAQLLFGTQAGAMGSALRSNVAQQAQEGQYRYVHPDQYGGESANPLSWLQLYQQMRPR